MAVYLLVSFEGSEAAITGVNMDMSGLTCSADPFGLGLIGCAVGYLGFYLQFMAVSSTYALINGTILAIFMAGFVWCVIEIAAEVIKV